MEKTQETSEENSWENRLSLDAQKEVQKIRKQMEESLDEKRTQEIEKEILLHWDQLFKPIEGLGKFEKMLAKIGGIQKKTIPDLSKRAMLIMCADNGVVEEGISQSGQEMTWKVTKNLAKGRSSVCYMAKTANVDVIPVDVGIASKTSMDGVWDYKVTQGTKNFLKQPAMTQVETWKAIKAGIDCVNRCKDLGFTILGTGEMGIGNTTTSSAMAAALLGKEVEELTGRGAGLSDDGLRRKKQVIAAALEQYGIQKNADAFTILSHVGGLDLAALTGVYIGGVIYRIPVILDGVISSVAALTAQRLFPGAKACMLPSHLGKEPASRLLLEELALSAVIQGDLALGEGTGAVMLFPLLDMAKALWENGETFQNSEVVPYERFQHREAIPTAKS